MATGLLAWGTGGSLTEQAPLLLKILAPLSEENLGDLYFELHDKKIEVYIVTHVDHAVWPNGIGKIRYGFNQTKRKQFSSDDAFKSGYLEAVQAYHRCRSQIDSMIDEFRANAGVASNDPVPPKQMRTWLDQLPKRMIEEEQQLRAHMESFTNLKDIRVGDVVRVEPFFPHSLQHGVRVIEFQTASYERYILSFGQKVLTQSGWDTGTALDKAVLDLPPEPAYSILASSPLTKQEVIADFAAFTAIRLTLESGATFDLAANHDYQLLICVDGQLSANNTELSEELAVILPAKQQVVLQTSSGAVCILARPKS